LANASKTWVGRREAKKALVLHERPLRVQIEADRGRAALGGFERAALDDHEADARHALHALVGRDDDRLEVEGRRVDRERAERGDRVDHQLEPAPAANRGDLLERVQDPGAGVAVAKGQMGDAGMGVERILDVFGRGRRHHRQLEPHQIDADALQKLAEAHAIEAILDDQNAAHVRGDQGLERSLAGIGAAALDRHAFVAAGAAGDLDQVATDVAGECDHLLAVRAAVEQHGLLDGTARGQRPRGQQIGFVAPGHDVPLT
jgi:hypothetical protein